MDRSSALSWSHMTAGASRIAASRCRVQTRKHRVSRFASHYSDRLLGNFLISFRSRSAHVLRPDYGAMSVCGTITNQRGLIFEQVHRQYRVWPDGDSALCWSIHAWTGCIGQNTVIDTEGFSVGSFSLPGLSAIVRFFIGTSLLIRGGDGRTVSSSWWDDSKASRHGIANGFSCKST